MASTPTRPPKRPQAAPADSTQGRRGDPDWPREKVLRLLIETHSEIPDSIPDQLEAIRNLARVHRMTLSPAKVTRLGGAWRKKTRWVEPIRENEYAGPAGTWRALKRSQGDARKTTIGVVLPEPDDTFIGKTMQGLLEGCRSPSPGMKPSPAPYRLRHQR